MLRTKHCIRFRKQNKIEKSTSIPDRAYIQEALLGASRVHDALSAPPLQRIGNFEIANSIVPARYVSGDFVVSFEQNGTWYVALGDLMGKGLSAAMWLAHVVDTLRRACELGGTLAEIMLRLNAEMHRSRIGVPLTAVFLIRLELGQGGLSYCSAGCPPAFRLSACHRVSTHDLGGPILGAVSNATYQAGSLDLSPGDTLLVVSDGIVEFHRGVEFELRPDQVIQHLQYTAGNHASDVVNSLTQKIRSQGSTIVDDLSVLAVQRVI
jgi:serine phosphatase RsbU (regulator of sigma subunit)